VVEQIATITQFSLEDIFIPNVTSFFELFYLLNL
jgi:hypothetical protein